MNAFTKLPTDNIMTLLYSTASTGTTADALLLSRRTGSTIPCHADERDHPKHQHTTNHSQRRVPSVVRRRHRHRVFQDHSTTLLNQHEDASSSSLLDDLQQQVQPRQQAPLRNHRVRKGTPTAFQSLFFFLDVIDEITKDDSDDDNSDESKDNPPSSKNPGPATVSTGSLMRMEGSSSLVGTRLSLSLASPLMRRAKQACACLVEDDDDDEDGNDDSKPKEWGSGRRTLPSTRRDYQLHEDYHHGVAAMDKNRNDDDWGFYEEHGEYDEE